MNVDFDIRTAEDARYAMSVLAHIAAGFDEATPGTMSAQARWDAQVAIAAVHGPHAGQPGDITD